MIGKLKFVPAKQIELDYFFSHYNMTNENERAVEIALALNWLKKQGKENLIEVGCVMPHYGKYTHRVIDLYEENPPYPVERINAEDFDYCDRDVLCVSTIEHIKHDANYISKTGFNADAAPNLLQRIMQEANTALFTWPAGVHPKLDQFVYDWFDTYNVYLFRRINRENQWEQVWDEELILSSKYAEPFPSGNLLIVVEK